MSTQQESLPIVPRRHERHRSLVGPLILIGLGALFLAVNFGLVSWADMRGVWQLWPLILVLFGVELVFGRSHWASAVVAILVVLLIGAVIAWAGFLSGTPRWNIGNWQGAAVVSPAGVQVIDENLGGTKAATVDLRHSAGRLTMSALPVDSDQLIHADLSHPENAAIYQDIRDNGNGTEISLRDANEADFPFVGNRYDQPWNIQLSRAVPIDLKIETGASALDLDLRDLKVTNLAINAGASGVKVALPEVAGQTEAKIEAGAAGIDVTVPQGVAARIHTSSALAGVTIDQSRFPSNGGYYQSPDYNTAANRVDLEIKAGVSGVTVR
ncbi:MAG: LiaI-LiaF-like domain-containing protein [Chloroflexota bacterium]